RRNGPRSVGRRVCASGNAARRRRAAARRARRGRQAARHRPEDDRPGPDPDRQHAGGIREGVPGRLSEMGVADQGLGGEAGVNGGKEFGLDISNALRQARPAAMSDDEWRLRLELAACYRLVDWVGWTELIFNHITVRVPSASGKPAYLINPFGLHYCE